MFIIWTDYLLCLFLEYTFNPPAYCVSNVYYNEIAEWIFLFSWVVIFFWWMDVLTRAGVEPGPPWAFRQILRRYHFSFHEWSFFLMDGCLDPNESRTWACWADFCSDTTLQLCLPCNLKILFVSSLKLLILSNFWIAEVLIIHLLGPFFI